MIEPVIAVADKHVQKAKRLQHYCRELDGTEITLICGEDHGNYEGYPHCATASFHLIAERFKGRPFLWMEPDSIPLRKGWLKEICNTYNILGKEFLLSQDSDPPFDLACGIGVYGPNTHWLIPQRFDRGAWDAWMVRHLPEMIARTPLIQHKYGHYNQSGDVIRKCSFPVDKDLLRPEAVLFHSDPEQTLIPSSCQLPSGVKTFRHTNCRGDIIAALASIKQLGGGDLILRNHPNAERMGFRFMKGAMLESLERLLKRQSYVKSVVYDDAPSIVDHDFTHFRRIYNGSFSLAETQARFIGIPKLDTAPWLECHASPDSKGRVIVARSARYHRKSFPWRAVSQKYGNRLLFVGLEEEKTALEKEIFRKIEWRKTEDLLEVAELVKGSSLCISNQTAVGWIAMGLGHPYIQETCRMHPDSIVKREKAWFGDDAIRRIEAMRIV